MKTFAKVMIVCEDDRFSFINKMEEKGFTLIAENSNQFIFSFDKEEKDSFDKIFPKENISCE